MNAIETLAATLATEQAPAPVATPKARKPRAPKVVKQETATQTQETAIRAPVSFFVKQGFRPSAGRLLFSYTHAWIIQSGLADGGSIDASAARKIAGDTAVSYHTNKTGCFEIVACKLTLTAAGQSKFGARATIGASLDGKAVDAFIETLTTGKANDYVKAEFAIGKL